MEIVKEKPQVWNIVFVGKQLVNGEVILHKDQIKDFELDQGWKVRIELFQSKYDSNNPF